VTYHQAAAILGMHYVSVMRLRRLGKLRPTIDGVHDGDVHRYLQRRQKPEGYIDGHAAASLLGVPARTIAAIARTASLRPHTMPRPGGGWWVHSGLVARLKRDHVLLASLGAKVDPPEGWVTRDHAAALIKRSRSWVTRLGKRGTIRTRRISRHNTWYSREDLEKYVVA
jgi:hypothetical protein